MPFGAWFKILFEKGYPMFLTIVSIVIGLGLFGLLAASAFAPKRF